MRIFVIISLLVSYSLCFSIPGVSIKTYKDKEQIEVFANEFDSIRTQIPFSYYYLNYCPAKDLDDVDENLGSILLGETTQKTPYFIYMNVNKTCTDLCSRELTHTDVGNFQWMIDREYYANLVIDNLPALFENDEDVLSIGFPVGFKKQDEYYVYNHLVFLISVYNDVLTKQKRVVGFHIMPYSTAGKTKKDEDGGSVKGSYCLDRESALKDYSYDQQKLDVGEIYYTYEVKFQESNKMIGSRWDSYQFLGDEEIHWLSILNSFVITLVLTLIIAHILRRTLRKDIKEYNELRTTEEVQEERGWKQLSRDVFRAPKDPMWLSVFVGTGVQLGSMMFLVLLIARLGFADQSYRGSLMTMIILFYNFMGIFAGYYSSRVYKMFGGSNWIKCTLLTGLVYPSVLFGTFYVINAMMLMEESSVAVHIGTISALVALWFGISMPLVFLGSLIGYKKQVIKHPCPPNPISRFVKPQPWYLSTWAVCLLGGLLPFGAVFIELVFIMMSIWRHSFYYLFAFLLAVVIILIITSAEISIVITYLQLCNGNHRIWWRSFLTTGSMAFYVFAYAVFYYITELELMRFSSICMYFGYMLMISFTLFIVCGSIGFLASYMFVRKIYSLIRID